MKTRIHVNGQSLKANKKKISGKYPQGIRNTVFTVKDYKRNRTGHLVEISGPSRLIYQPEHPMKSGAVAWIETEAPVTVFREFGMNQYVEVV